MKSLNTIQKLSKIGKVLSKIAFIFSVIGFFYIKNRGKGRFAGKLIPHVKSKDADFLKRAEEEEELEEALRKMEEESRLKKGKKTDCR